MESSADLVCHTPIKKYKRNSNNISRIVIIY
jgi:hypothetical protein